MSIKERPIFGRNILYFMIAKVDSRAMMIWCEKSRKISASRNDREDISIIMSNVKTLDVFPDFSYKDEFMKAIFEVEK